MKRLTVLIIVFLFLGLGVASAKDNSHGYNTYLKRGNKLNNQIEKYNAKYNVDVTQPGYTPDPNNKAQVKQFNRLVNINTKLQNMPATDFAIGIQNQRLDKAKAFSAISKDYKALYNQTGNNDYNVKAAKLDNKIAGINTRLNTGINVHTKDVNRVLDRDWNKFSKYATSYNTHTQNSNTLKDVAGQTSSIKQANKLLKIAARQDKLATKDYNKANYFSGKLDWTVDKTSPVYQNIKIPGTNN